MNLQASAVESALPFHVHRTIRHRSPTNDYLTMVGAGDGNKSSGAKACLEVPTPPGSDARRWEICSARPQLPSASLGKPKFVWPNSTPQLINCVFFFYFSPGRYSNLKGLGMESEMCSRCSPTLNSKANTRDNETLLFRHSFRVWICRVPSKEEDGRLYMCHVGDCQTTNNLAERAPIVPSYRGTKGFFRQYHLQENNYRYDVVQIYFFGRIKSVITVI